jgi:hypothetical protein
MVRTFCWLMVYRLFTGYFPIFYFIHYILGVLHDVSLYSFEFEKQKQLNEDMHRTRSGGTSTEPLSSPACQNRHILMFCDPETVINGFLKAIRMFFLKCVLHKCVLHLLLKCLHVNNSLVINLHHLLFMGF